MAPDRRVYLDYNATAPVRAEVRRAVEPLVFAGADADLFGNPSSIHWAGQAARKQLEAARTRVAKLFDRRAGEVIFTSGGTEADNLALLGVALEQRPGAQVIISAVEHPAVMEAARRLEVDHGVPVVRIP